MLGGDGGCKLMSCRMPNPLDKGVIGITRRFGLDGALCGMGATGRVGAAPLFAMSGILQYVGPPAVTAFAVGWAAIGLGWIRGAAGALGVTVTRRVGAVGLCVAGGFGASVVLFGAICDFGICINVAAALGAAGDFGACGCGTAAAAGVGISSGFSGISASVTGTPWIFFRFSRIS